MHSNRHKDRARRHRFGTRLRVVSEVPGHSSTGITKDGNGRLLEGGKRAAAESMSRALFGG